MITKSKAFLTSDNQVFLTQEEAQKHELLCIFESEPWQVSDLTKDHERALRERVVAIIWTQRDLLVAALSTRKPRTPKTKTAKVNKANRAAAVNAALQDTKQ